MAAGGDASGGITFLEYTVEVLEGDILEVELVEADHDLDPLPSITQYIIEEATVEVTTHYALLSYHRPYIDWHALSAKPHWAGVASAVALLLVLIVLVASRCTTRRSAETARTKTKQALDRYTQIDVLKVRSVSAVLSALRFHLTTDVKDTPDMKDALGMKDTPDLRDLFAVADPLLEKYIELVQNDVCLLESEEQLAEMEDLLQALLLRAEEAYDIARSHINSSDSATDKEGGWIAWLFPSYSLEKEAKHFLAPYHYESLRVHVSVIVDTLHPLYFLSPRYLRERARGELRELLGALERGEGAGGEERRRLSSLLPLLREGTREDRELAVRGEGALCLLHLSLLSLWTAGEGARKGEEGRERGPLPLLLEEGAGERDSLSSDPSIPPSSPPSSPLPPPPLLLSPSLSPCILPLSLLSSLPPGPSPEEVFRRERAQVLPLLSLRAQSLLQLRGEREKGQATVRERREKSMERERALLSLLVSLQGAGFASLLLFLALQRCGGKEEGERGEAFSSLLLLCLEGGLRRGRELLQPPLSLLPTSLFSSPSPRLLSLTFCLLPPLPSLLPATISPLLLPLCRELGLSLLFLYLRCLPPQLSLSLLSRLYCPPFLAGLLGALLYSLSFSDLLAPLLLSPHTLLLSFPFPPLSLLPLLLCPPLLSLLRALHGGRMPPLSLLGVWGTGLALGGLCLLLSLRGG